MINIDKLTWLDGKDPLQCLAASIELKKCIESKDNITGEYNYISHLPIYIDATCNGFQHLSLLSSDQNFADELNLTESKWSDKPKDFYSFLLNNLIGYFHYN
nr:hypothetical protein [Ceratocystis fimbriata]WPM94766.1 hypothetical protein [Ceratocystis fimbriata]